MRTLYNENNDEISAEDDQVELLLAAGFSESPVEVKPTAAPTPAAKPAAAPATK